MANEKGTKIATQLRIDEDVYERLRKVADREIRSINAQMEYFIIRGLEQYEIDNDPNLF